MTAEARDPELQVISWYEKNEWQQLKTILRDADRLPENYDDWLRLAEAAVAELESDDVIVVRVTIDTVLFPAWCKQRGKSTDAEARTLFAIETVQKQQFMNNMQPR